MSQENPPNYQQYPHVPYPVPTPRPTNALAIVSLITGFLWIFWIGSIVAVITGHISLKQFKQNPNQEAKWAAIVGLVLGYIGVGTILLFIFTMCGAAMSDPYNY